MTGTNEGSKSRNARVLQVFIFPRTSLPVLPQSIMDITKGKLHQKNRQPASACFSLIFSSEGGKMGGFARVASVLFNASDPCLFHSFFFPRLWNVRSGRGNGSCAHMCIFTCSLVSELERLAVAVACLSVYLLAARRPFAFESLGIFFFLS